MANKCLVTKLKGSVQNENLPFLGFLSVSFNVTAENALSAMVIGKIRCNKDLNYGSTVIPANTETAVTNAHYLVGNTPGTYILYISKESTYIQLESTPVEPLDIDEFKFYSNLKVIKGSWGRYKGSIESIKGIEEISVSSNGLTGNIDLLTNLNPNLSNITCSSANLTGTGIQFTKLLNLQTLWVQKVTTLMSLDDFAANQIREGRTTGTLVTHTKYGDKTITYDPSLPNGYSIS